jgi:hypothetical protein
LHGLVATPRVKGNYILDSLGLGKPVGWMLHMAADIIVDAYEFENLWPKKDLVADGKRRKFLRKARKRGLDKAEIQRLS